MQAIKNENNLFCEMAKGIRNISILFFALTSLAYSAGSGVGLNGTRIVYIQGDESTSIGARNNTSINYLAKFIVTKNANGTSNTTVPFMVTPPLVKIDSGKSQEVRIYAQQNSLPKDRESIFYFSATMIPATDGPINGNALNIGYNNVIKLFYRPTNLKMSPRDAHENLKIVANATGITVVNNSPYYISLSNLVVNGVEIDLSMSKRNTMISPFDSFNYVAPSKARLGIAKWTVINDLGGEDVFSGQVK